MIHKSVPKGHPTSPFEAFRQLAYTFGVAELAQHMGLKPGTLYNKADADEETHHQPTLRDVVLATRLTRTCGCWILWTSSLAALPLMWRRWRR